jgi:hypothetical protein
MVFIFIIVLKKSELLPKIGKKIAKWEYLFIWLLVMFLPNTMYASYEIRHLILIDNIADNGTVHNLNNLSYLVFGGISLLGIITTIYLNVLLVRYYAKSNLEIFIYLTSLCFIQSFGSVAGLMDYFSVDGLFFPPLVFHILWQIFITQRFLVISVISTVFMFMISLIFLYKHIHSFKGDQIGQ